MTRTRRPRTLVRPLLAAVVAVTAGLSGVLVTGAPAPADDVIDIVSRTVLVVTPGDRTAPGTELTLTATVSIGDVPAPGETVRLVVDGALVATLDTDEAGTASTTVTPAPGAHTLTARYDGRGTEVPGASIMPSRDDVAHSVLPATCPDQAHPGAGAVVRHAYLVALRRCPDAAGYAYWVDRLEAGGSSGAPAAALARSAEAMAVVVDDAYRRVLDRPADPGGRAVWAAKLRAGWTTSQLWAALAASPEFAMGITGTDLPASLVERAFRRIVGRPLGPAASNYWQQHLSARGPSSTWRALALTAEVVGGVVADAYLSALGRPASPSEVSAARATIRTRRGDWRLLTADLLGRPEALAHAQRYPDPEVDG